MYGLKCKICGKILKDVEAFKVNKHIMSHDYSDYFESVKLREDSL